MVSLQHCIARFFRVPPGQAVARPCEREAEGNSDDASDFILPTLEGSTVARDLENPPKQAAP